MFFDAPLSISFTQPPILRESLPPKENFMEPVNGMPRQEGGAAFVELSMTSYEQAHMEVLNEVSEYTESKLSIGVKVLKKTLGIDEDEKEVAEKGVNIKEPDGNEDESVDEEFLRSAELTVEARRETVTNVAAQTEHSDPLALDMNGDGVISTTGVDRGVLFDIDGDGAIDQVSSISGGDAFLGIDKNGNGYIDSGVELFGDQNGAKNGFEELRKYDSNDDGWIDKQDKVYSDLGLVSRLGPSINFAETISLADAGVAAIKVGSQDITKSVSNGDLLTQASVYLRNDGSRGATYDVGLLTRKFA